jgi:hypothetical protein
VSYRAGLQASDVIPRHSLTLPVGEALEGKRLRQELLLYADRHFMMRGMQRPSWHRPRVLLLALLLGLGTSLSAGHGAVMMAEIAAAMDEHNHGPGGCDACGGDHENMDAGTCLAICGIAAPGLIPGELLTLPPASRTEFQVARLQLSGEFHSPDHGPPKAHLADA